MLRDFATESLAHDPIHGYIPFVSKSGLPKGEVSEQEIIDHPWVQRMRHIHQLQTAWWVFPSAEHNRFQHVLGAMHLASRVMEHWYDSLKESCSNVPSRAYVESLARMAAISFGNCSRVGTAMGVVTTRRRLMSLAGFESIKPRRTA